MLWRIFNRFEDWLTNLGRSLRQGGCKHWWQPALLNGKPAKHCSDCELSVPLTHEEFYAQFGRTPPEMWSPDARR